VGNFAPALLGIFDPAFTHVITTGVILALLAGIALKLRIFGDGG